jgi:hypothetical protein
MTRILMGRTVGFDSKRKIGANHGHQKVVINNPKLDVNYSKNRFLQDRAPHHVFVIGSDRVHHYQKLIVVLRNEI